jgi:putative mycofactocin binding protein MftB
VASTSVSNPSSFDPARPWRLDPQVALRDEAFGALAYHYGTRRLVFLKSRHLVEVVRGLEGSASATEAIAAVVDEHEVPAYEAALNRLARSEIIHAA